MSPLDLTNVQPIPPVWVIMPIRAHRDYTIAAIGDVLQQSVPVILLLVNQGVDDDFRTELERIAEAHAHVLLWSHVPPLPSLSATWNRALDCAWEAGAEHALVVNNDVRLHAATIDILRRILQANDALFVSCVGVTAEQFDASRSYSATWEDITGPALNNIGLVPMGNRGGPDFSCFLISKECHDRFTFDEGFIPAFCEDLDYHRRLMLAGEGQRIFSVNLPYLHYASATLKALPEQEAARVRQQIEQVSRAYYARKWGGPVNQETYFTPFNAGNPTSRPGVYNLTTPELQRRVQAGEALPTIDDSAFLGQQGNYQPLQARVAAGELLSDRENEALNEALQRLHGLLACDPAADITGFEDWRQPRPLFDTCGQMVPTGTGSVTCQRPLGHAGVCSGGSQ